MASRQSKRSTALQCKNGRCTSKSDRNLNQIGRKLKRNSSNSWNLGCFWYWWDFHINDWSFSEISRVKSRWLSRRLFKDIFNFSLYLVKAPQFAILQFLKLSLVGLHFALAGALLSLDALSTFLQRWFTFRPDQQQHLAFETGRWPWFTFLWEKF